MYDDDISEKILLINMPCNFLNFFLDLNFYELIGLDTKNTEMSSAKNV